MENGAYASVEMKRGFTQFLVATLASLVPNLRGSPDGIQQVLVSAKIFISNFSDRLVVAGHRVVFAVSNYPMSSDFVPFDFKTSQNNPHFTAAYGGKVT